MSAFDLSFISFSETCLFILLSFASFCLEGQNYELSTAFQNYSIFPTLGLFVPESILPCLFLVLSVTDKHLSGGICLLLSLSLTSNSACMPVVVT